jgi:hypothetical protein
VATYSTSYIAVAFCRCHTSVEITDLSYNKQENIQNTKRIEAGSEVHMKVQNF